MTYYAIDDCLLEIKGLSSKIWRYKIDDFSRNSISYPLSSFRRMDFIPGPTRSSSPRVFPSFSHHPARQSAPCSRSLSRPTNISPMHSSTYSRGSRAYIDADAYRRNIFRIVRRIPVVSGRDVKLPGG